MKAVEEYARACRLKNVQHAKRGGEFRIPNTRYRADGFHARTGTVIEFMGDQFHGNPKMYAGHERVSPFARNRNGKPHRAATLYKRTMRRVRTIQNLGYNVAVIWESDFKRICKTGESIKSIVQMHVGR